MARYFGVPFATTGDKIVVPDAVQPDGSVNFATGFGFDYQRPNTDPGYKPVPRDGMNGLFHDITEAIGDIQRQGVADWTVDAAPYPINAMVRHSDKVWRSLVANNSATPEEGANWAEVDANSVRTSGSQTIDGIKTFLQSPVVPTPEPADNSAKAINSEFFKSAQATEAMRGTAEIATQAEMDAGDDDARIATPKKLRFGFAASLTGNGYVKLPSWLGGVVFQWGKNSSSSSGPSTHSFPIAFPTAALFIIGGQGNVAAHFRGAADIVSKSQFRVSTMANAEYGSDPVSWFAIGH